MTAEQRAMHDRIDPAKQGVAGLHRGKNGMQCGTCHDEKVALAPDDNQTVEIRPGVLYTMGRLRIDRKTQVLKADRKPVPGLLAGGEVTGGVHGANRLGGNSISETITFGRIAATQAGAYLQQARKLKLA